MRKKHLLFVFTFILVLLGTNVVNAQSFAGNIVSQWSLENAIVDSKTGATGEILGDGGTSYIDGKFGKALDFTGAEANSIVIIEDDGTLDPINFTSQSFSVSMWAMVDPSYETEQTLLMKGSNSADDVDEDGVGAPGANGQRYTIHTKNGEVRFAVDDDATKTQLGVSVDDIEGGYPLGEWVNIVGVRDRDAVMIYLYMNGQLIGSTDDGTGDLNTSGQRLMLGNFTNRANVAQGPIDEILIINKALSATEVMEIYTSTSIHSPKYSGSLKIQPTFVNNTLSIQEISDYNTIEIYNLTGALVKSVSNVDNTINMDVNELTTGKYIVKGIGEDKVSVGSFIKQ